MPHDPELLAETRSWFLKWSRDLEAGEFELTAPSPFTEYAVFHAQQAAEKALKGFLVRNGVPFRKTHSLEELGAQCEAVDGGEAGDRQGGATDEVRLGVSLSWRVGGTLTR